MASTRAFGIFNHQNRTNGNNILGKNAQLLKPGETRTTAAFALKDLTNSNKAQRISVHQDGKEKAASIHGKSLKSTTNSVLQMICNDMTKDTPKKPSHITEDTFAPQNAEYAWGQAACLRDDLLEQMIDFVGMPCEIKRKPLKPTPPKDPLDLPDLMWDDYAWPASRKDRFDPVKPMDLPEDDLPLKDIQELEFLF
ncbi:uncharacterized protein LOC128726858 [Anopheles nili]|uniref:uncharacterized protein LOC128726858 n=1 Tax=Anopheles nili TaxID=185578 RepID=UPI00237BE81D|nr:uncharacterized protein LOC128726858 [Anopheles nili]